MLRSLGGVRRDRPEVPDIRGSAYLDFGVGNELIGRHCQGGRRRPLTNTSGGVVLRTVAGAEKAVVISLMGDRDAAQMGADADHDQPLIVPLLDPRLIGLRIRKARERHAAGLLDLLLGTMADVDWLSPREHLDVLPLGDRGEI